MAPTILVAGATGNTGRSVVQTLSQLLQANSNPQNYRVLALTRSSSSGVAQQLARLPHVEVAELNWVDASAEWLRQHGVARAFIAPHNQPDHLAHESAFHLAARDAGLEYVVRISTTAANVRPDCPAYYPRSHWAVEALLSSPEFESLPWTSLQPNVFSAFYLGAAAEFVKSYEHARRTGEPQQGDTTLRLMAAEDVGAGIVEADDVGALAAHLLAERDPARHNRAKYVVNGPEDITGRQIVDMVEERIGAPVPKVSYKDASLADLMAAQSPEPKSIILSIKHAMDTNWAGKCKASTTSREVLEIAAPKTTPAESFKALLQG